jgi:hypothetical protein
MQTKQFIVRHEGHIVSSLEPMQQSSIHVKTAPSIDSAPAHSQCEIDLNSHCCSAAPQYYREAYSMI